MVYSLREKTVEYLQMVTENINSATAALTFKMASKEIYFQGVSCTKDEANCLFLILIRCCPGSCTVKV